jgi:Transglycosylase SLT domain
MARLTIEQTRAPDFSASSEMLARAGDSFNTGIESAKGILGKYAEGQTAKGDQALVGALAGLSSEEELATFLQTTDLGSMNISDTMRQNILTARETILGNDSTRQSTVNAADSNSRANAGEGRVAAEYADGVAARDELRALTPSYVAALEEGQRTGRSSGVVAGVDLGAVEANYNLPAGYMATMAQIESGGDPNAQNASSSAGGLFQQLDANAQAYGVANRFDPAQSADGAARFAVDNANVLRGVLGREPTGGELYLAHQQGPGGARSLLRNPDARAVDVVGAEAVQLNGGHPDMTAGEFANLWISKFDRIQGNAPAADPTIRSNQMGGEAAAAFTAALQAGTRMTPDAAADLFNSVLGQQAQGQSLIDTAESARQAEAVAAATRDAILNPNNLSEDAVTRDLMTIDGVSAANTLAAAGQDRSAFGGVIAPAIGADQQVTDALARTAATDARTAGNDPIARSFALAESIDASGDVGGTLLSEFDLPEGSGVDPAYVDRVVQQLADDAGVTPGQMATVMSQTANGNVEMFNEMLNATADTEMYSNLKNIADTTFGAEAQSTYESQRAESSRREAERASTELQLSTARTRAAKLPVGSDARAAADAEVNALRDTVLAGMTPQEREQNLVDYISKTGMGSRLQGLNPESAEFYRAMAQLEETIKTDSSLSEAEKDLLLRDIRG